MDGPVIQAATQSTLERGFRLEELFEAVAAITARTSVPVLVMTYWNPVLRFGVDRFAERLAAAGGAGLITPDLTPENAEEWLAAAERHDLDRIFLAAPSSSDARIDRAVAASRGFVYTVSTMGTTGARTDVDHAARTLAERIAARAEANGQVALRCVGLGISTAEQVRDVLDYADGVIVGSALVRALGAGGVPAVRELAASLAAGTLDGGPASAATATEPASTSPASTSPAPTSPEKSASA
jgi:tryptophan synthase alpha chain